MWVTIFGLNQSLHQLLIEGDISLIHKHLKDPSGLDLFYGFENCAKTLFKNGFSRNVNAQNDHARALVKKIRQLGIFLGAKRLPNPAQPLAKDGPPPFALEDVEKILNEIDALYNTHISFPNPFPQEYGIQTRRGICSYRAIQALYQAIRLKELSKFHGAKILEIGAGLGRTAFYARALGLTNYTIVDIPLTTVAQGIFLGSKDVLGENSISLVEEPFSEGQLRIRSPEWLLESDERFDIMINVDSITEMDQKIATQYAKWASERIKLVFSINHEVNPFTAKEIFCSYFTSMSRSLYWMRRGYVEEIFSPYPFSYGVYLMHMAPMAMACAQERGFRKPRSTCKERHTGPCIYTYSTPPESFCFSADRTPLTTTLERGASR